MCQGAAEQSAAEDRCHPSAANARGAVARVANPPKVDEAPVAQPGPSIPIRPVTPTWKAGIRLPLRDRLRAMALVALLVVGCAAAAGVAIAQTTAGEAERRTVEEMQRRGMPVPSAEERRRLIQGFFPSLGRATFDTTPLAFEIADTRLVVPANYVSDLYRDAEGQTTMLVLHVLLPGMDGVTPANAACVRVAPNCPEYVRVILRLPRRPPTRDILANVLRMWPEAERVPWVNGVEIIKTAQASDGSGQWTYHAERPVDDQALLSRCSIHAGGVMGGCIANDNPIGKLAFSYVFSGRQVEQLVQIDDQIRTLLRSFMR